MDLQATIQSPSPAFWSPIKIFGLYIHQKPAGKEVKRSRLPSPLIYLSLYLLLLHSPSLNCIFMIKFNAKDSIELIYSSNHDVFRDIKVAYKGRLLLIQALCKIFTKNNLGSIEWINVSKMSIKRFFKLLLSLLWRDIFWYLVG